MNVIVASSTPTVARLYVRTVLLMTELVTGEPMLDTPVEVRPVLHQGRFW